MNTLSAAWALAQKDLRSFVRDRTALVLSILVPIALVSVFGWIMAYAFGGSGGGMPKVSLHVADLDVSPASERFITRLEGLDMIRVQRLVLQGTSDKPPEERLSKLIRDGDAHHILVLPAGFNETLDRQETPKFQMLRDPGREMEDKLISLSVAQAAMAELGGDVFVDAMERMLAEQGMDTGPLTLIRSWMTNIGDTIGDFAESTAADTSATEAPVAEGGSATDAPVASTEASSGPDPAAMLDFMSNVVPMATTDVSPPDRGKQVTYQQAQSVAGMTVMMLLFALTSCGSVLLTEREDGTLRRLFAQPVSRNAILLGKFIFVFLVGVCQMAILFTYGEWMFRVGMFRDPVTLIVLSLTWVAAGSAFGMFLAAVSRSTKQAESLASLLILMMAALGGCWFPLQMMSLPPLLDAVCKSTMTYWAMSGFQGMLWSQLEWDSSKTLLAISWQLGWVVVLTGLAVFFFRRNFCRG